MARGLDRSALGATPGDARSPRRTAFAAKLGLGDLIDRMPGGLQQPGGETGWQLSYGERSRVFMLRAIAGR